MRLSRNASTDMLTSSRTALQWLQNGSRRELDGKHRAASRLGNIAGATQTVLQSTTLPLGARLVHPCSGAARHW